MLEQPDHGGNIGGVVLAPQKPVVGPRVVVRGTLQSQPGLPVAERHLQGIAGLGEVFPLAGLGVAVQMEHHGLLSLGPASLAVDVCAAAGHQLQHRVDQGCRQHGERAERGDGHPERRWCPPVSGADWSQTA